MILMAKLKSKQFTNMDATAWTIILRCWDELLWNISKLSPAYQLDKNEMHKAADIFLMVINVLELTRSSRQLPPVIRELLGRIRVRMSITQNKSIMLIIWPQLYPQH